MTRRPDYKGAITYCLARLRDELSPKLTYHNVCHTERGVIPVGARLAQHSGVDEREMRLLETAAAFHEMSLQTPAQALQLGSWPEKNWP